MTNLTIKPLAIDHTVTNAVLDRMNARIPGMTAMKISAGCIYARLNNGWRAGKEDILGFEVRIASTDSAGHKSVTVAPSAIPSLDATFGDGKAARPGDVAVLTNWLSAEAILS